VTEEEDRSQATCKLLRGEGPQRLRGHEREDSVAGMIERVLAPESNAWHTGGRGHDGWLLYPAISSYTCLN
jgi:hypothetical protein